jgi:hypothetical protein
MNPSTAVAAATSNRKERIIVVMVRGFLVTVGMNANCSEQQCKQQLQDRVDAPLQRLFAGPVS